MPKPLTKPAVLRESWRPHNVAQLRAQKQQLAVRLTFTALLTLLASLTLYLIFSPLFHPKTRLYFLTSGPQGGADLPPVSFFKEDALRFLTANSPLDMRTALSNLAFLETPETCTDRFETIVDSLSSDSDVAIVYLAAHPVIINNRPYLRCDNFDASQPLKGAIGCDQLIDLLTSISSGYALVLLDTGSCNDEQHLLFDDAAYSKMLDDLVLKNASPNFNILVSHSPGEQAFRSLNLKGSIFSLACSLGLAGMADDNADRQISVDEFYRFVMGATNTIVQHESGAISVQHPRLLGSPNIDQIALSQRILGSAPSQRSLKIPEQYGVSSQVTGFSMPAPVAAEAEKPTPDQGEESESFQSSLQAYIARKKDDITDDLRNELTMTMIRLPKPLARGVRLSVDSAQKIAEDSLPTSAEASTEQPSTEQQTTPEAVDTDDTTTGTTPEGEAPASTPAAAENGTVLSSRPDFPDVSRVGESDPTGLLLLAWELTNYLERMDQEIVRPVDVAPQAWRRWRSHLLETEERIRVGGVLDERQIRLELTSEILGAYQIASGQTVTVGAYMKDVSQQATNRNWQSEDRQVTQFPSLGMYRNMTRFGIVDTSPELERIDRDYKNALKGENQTALDELLRSIENEDLLRLNELFYARLLLNQSSIPWGMTQELLQIRYELEMAASSPWSTHGQLELLLTRTQQLQLYATRLALDSIGSDWLTRCEQTALMARSELGQVQRREALLHEAWQWRNQVMLELPSLLSWQQTVADRFDAHSTVIDLDQEFTALLVQLQQLSQAMRSREELNFDALELQLRACKQRHASMRGMWLGRLEQLAARSDEPGTGQSDGWTVDALLATDLVIDTQRQQLLEWKFETESLPELRSQPTLAVPQRLDVSTKAEKRLALISQLAQLADLSVEPNDANQGFINLPSQLSNRLTTPEVETEEQRLARLRAVDPMLRMAFQGPLIDQGSYATDLWRSEFSRVCRAQQQRSQLAFDDALPEEIDQWNRVVRQSQELEASLANRAAVRSGYSLPVVARAPTMLSLITQSETTAELTWKNIKSDLNQVWLMVEYDPNVLELTSTSPVTLLNPKTLASLLGNSKLLAEQELLRALSQSNDSTVNAAVTTARGRLEQIDACLQYPCRPLFDSAPSLTLAAGQSITIPFTIRRIGPGAGESKVVWKLISDRDYVRHEVKVKLADYQKMRLVSDGPRNTWTESDEGVVLHPWPNRNSQFRIGIANEGVARLVDFELLQLEERHPVVLPNGFVDASISTELANRLGSVQSIVTQQDLALSAQTGIQWLRLAAVGDQPTEPQEAKPDAAATQTERAVGKGLVAVFTDKTTGSKLWRRIDFRVRHPRGYIQPNIRYDAISERIVVQLSTSPGYSTAGNSSLDPTLTTTGIPVRGRPLTPLEPGTEMRLDGLLTESSILELYCEVPSQVTGNVTLALDIDQYPRAFVFDVPCWRSQNDIPLVMDHQHVRIVQPIEGLITAGSEAQAVGLEIDAFPGTFASGRDYVEVGWDLDRDRELIGEPALRLHSDRAVEVTLQKVVGEQMQLFASVKDLQVTLAPPTLPAARMNLLARVSAGGSSVWSEPRETIADNQPPVITGVELTPDVVLPHGAELGVMVGVEDNELSGVASVKLCVDRAANGQWDDKGTIITCAKNEDGVWTGLLPTEPLPTGRVNLLFQATDRAGNMSELTKTSVRLLNKEDWSKRQGDLGVEVSGTISFGSNPLNAAKLTLENEAGKVVYEVQSNDLGRFRFAKVLPGKYSLKGIGVAKNRPRIAQLPIEIKDASASPLRLKLEAK